MKTSNKINSLSYEADCTSISQRKWNEYMKGTTKANGAIIRKHIKKHLPDLYNQLALQFPNPLEYKSVKKEVLFVYVHSGIEYFIKYK